MLNHECYRNGLFRLCVSRLCSTWSVGGCMAKGKKADTDRGSTAVGAAWFVGRLVHSEAKQQSKQTIKYVSRNSLLKLQPQGARRFIEKSRKIGGNVVVHTILNNIVVVHMYHTSIIEEQCVRVWCPDRRSICATSFVAYKHLILHY